MKAIIINEYGDSSVLQYKENVSIPVLSPNQVLIKVKAASINPLDWKIRQGDLHCFLRSSFPIILGNDIAGTIVKVGSQVPSNFRVGDDVFCMLGTSPEKKCQQFEQGGGYAEYAVARADALCHMPSKVSYVEAAAVPLAALTAYQALVSQGNVIPGQRILINGASGGVGIYAVQIAKVFQAEVVAVARKKNAKLLLSLGADKVIDYAEYDFTKGKELYDVVYDVVSNRKFSEVQKVLTPTGRFITNIANFNSAIAFPLVSPILQIWGYSKVYTHVWVHSSGNDLRILRELIEYGKIKPIVSATFPLKDAKCAHDFVEGRHSYGKVVLDLEKS